MKVRTRAGTLVVSLLWAAGWASGNGQPIPKDVKAHHAKQYSDYHTGLNIVSETQAGRDVDKTIEVLPPLYAYDPSEIGSSGGYPNHELRGLACAADAIVVGAPKTAEAGITESGDFLFTDYTFDVASVIKSNQSTLNAGSAIIVTRPGGATTLNGHFVKISTANFPQFDFHQQYLLFLRFLSTTQTYKAFRSGTFVLSPYGSVAPIDSNYKLQTKSAKQKDAFLTEVRAAATAPCSGITPTLN